MKINRILFCVIFLVSATAYAESTPTKLGLAKQLVKLLQFDIMFKDDAKECARPQNSPSGAADAYRSNPERFEGLTPSSTYWSEVEAIYARYQAKICNFASTDRLTQYFAEQFAERTNEDDLRASIAFYSSPAGQRLQTMTLELNRDFQAYSAQLMRKAHEDAQEQYQREIHELLSKFHGASK